MKFCDKIPIYLYDCHCHQANKLIHMWYIGQIPALPRKHPHKASELMPWEDNFEKLGQGIVTHFLEYHST